MKSPQKQIEETNQELNKLKEEVKSLKQQISENNLLIDENTAKLIRLTLQRIPQKITTDQLIIDACDCLLGLYAIKQNRHINR